MSIWKHKEIKDQFTEGTNFITLGEGNTPLDKVNVQTNTLFFKREDKNPTGSWKDRAIAYKLTELLEKGITEAVISSTGNAAISLLKYVENLDFKLHIVISPDANPEKIKIVKELASNKHSVYEAKNAKKESIQISLKTKAPLLRSSTDPNLQKAYWSLGLELAKTVQHEQNKNTYLICSASSGTALVGLVQGLFMKLESESSMPRIIVCQTDKCNPIVRSLYSELEQNDKKTSLADAISNQSVLRLPQIISAIKKTEGDAFSISDDELLNAKKWAENTAGIPKDLSYTSLLSVAGFLRLQDDNENSKFILITSGR